MRLGLVKKRVLNLFAICAFGFGLGCGVKGDPLPPELPPEIGRGEPTYRRSLRSMGQEKGLDYEDWGANGHLHGERDKEEDSDEE